eukprot:scaffold10647_cov113-Isochrysis_galbana.AAC.16
MERDHSSYDLRYAAVLVTRDSSNCSLVPRSLVFVNLALNSPLAGRSSAAAAPTSTSRPNERRRPEQPCITQSHSPPRPPVLLNPGVCIGSIAFRVAPYSKRLWHGARGPYSFFLMPGSDSMYSTYWENLLSCFALSVPLYLSARARVWGRLALEPPPGGCFTRGSQDGGVARGWGGKSACVAHSLPKWSMPSCRRFNWTLAVSSGVARERSILFLREPAAISSSAISLCAPTDAQWRGVILKLSQTWWGRERACAGWSGVREGVLPPPQGVGELRRVRGRFWRRRVVTSGRARATM